MGQVFPSTSKGIFEAVSDLMKTLHRPLLQGLNIPGAEGTDRKPSFMEDVHIAMDNFVEHLRCE